MERGYEMRYKLITAEGKVSYKDKMTLKEMQDFVGGYIELSGKIICNEDGLMLKLPVNQTDRRFVGNIIVK